MIGDWGIVVAGSLVGLGVIVVCVRWWQKRKLDSLGSDDTDDLTIDLSALPIVSVSDDPLIEFYSMPVQLRILVIAPIGRSASLPDKQHLPSILQNVIPHFMEVVNAHEPIFRAWDGQPSIEGFKQAFFNNISLPGNRGVGTHWSSITGRFSGGDSRYLIGMAFSSELPNPIGEITIAHDAQWMDVLRIRR